MASKAQDDDLVMNLVELALSRPQDEQRAYVESTCSGDIELLMTVWKYVQDEQRMNGFLLEPLYSPPASEHRASFWKAGFASCAKWRKGAWASCTKLWTRS